MQDLDNYLKNYAEQLNFERYKISNKNLTEIKNIKVFITLGDLDSVIVYSKIIYPQLKKEELYNIFISWKNVKCFVDSADEFWCLSDENTIKNIYNKTDGLDNRADGMFGLLRSLKETFLNVETATEVEKYYKHFITNEFKKEFPSCYYTYPEITPPYYLNQDFVKKIQNLERKKVVFMPFLYNYIWQNNKKMPFKKYEEIVRKVASVLSDYYDLIIIQNEFTFDLSKYFKKDDVTIVREHDFGKILTIISMGDVYLDFFSNSYLLGFLSKKKMYIVFDKQSWFQFKKYEDIQIFNKCKHYVTFPSFFSFPSFQEDMLEDFVKIIVKGINDTYNYNVPEFSDTKVSIDFKYLAQVSNDFKLKKKVFFKREKK
jgi:hypothetical protein